MKLTKDNIANVLMVAGTVLVCISTYALVDKVAYYEKAISTISNDMEINYGLFLATQDKLTECQAEIPTDAQNRKKRAER